MKVNHVLLRNFRNYKTCDLKTSNSVNILYGNNAQGKTNILEGIYYGAFGISHRTSKEEELLKLEDEVANDLIKKTIFACSTEESRPIFTGILFEKKGNVINCVGTNTHRLALKSTTVETGLNDDFSLIIPSRVLKEIIANINPSVPQDIEFGLFNRQIMVKIDNVTIISGLIEGKFPDYNRVIPASFDIHCQVDKRKLLGSIKRVALFSTQTDYSLVKITIKSNQIVVQSGNSDFGTAEELVECKTTGDEMKVAFNAKYLLDILKIVESDEVLMELNSSRPCGYV